MTFLRRLKPLSIAIGLCIASVGYAGELRFGGALGYGGAGLSKTLTIENRQYPISRSEGPGMISIFVDYLISDSFSLALDHSRGFRLGPATSGVAFTTVIGRWYFLGPAPSAAKTIGENTTFLYKRFTPFFGIGSGLASGSTFREDDVVQDVDASGISIGYRFGVDYQLSPGMVLRPEISYSTSLSSTQGGLGLFAVQCGIVFF